jgi:nitroreductase
MSREALELLLTRRSVKPGMLGEPGPSPEQLTTILTAAARVPDHKKLAPWRFVVFEGEARAAFGGALAAA